MVQLWGILNVTPDSFSDGGRYRAPDLALEHALELHRAGAAMIDVGGESTRPGAQRVAVELEQARVLPVVRALAEEGIAVSVDTMNAATAREAIRAGARAINDVSGGQVDPGMFAAVADSDVDFVLGHWRGPSADMYAHAHYSHIGVEVAVELRSRVAAAVAGGVSPARIVLDPGIGFAKNAAQNWSLLRNLDAITGLGHRVMVGTSRKRFLNDAVGDDADQGQRDLATAVTTVLAAQAGVWAVRVHEVAGSRDALAVLQAWQGE